MLRRVKRFISERKHSADDLVWLAAKWLELRAAGRSMRLSDEELDR